MQKVVIKLLRIKVYYCWSLANAVSPSRCSRSWYLLNKVFHKSITWITTLMVIKGLSWPMRMYEININNITCSYIILPCQTTKMSCIHRPHKLMDRISTYDSSSLVGLGLNGDYSVWRVQCPHLHTILQSQDFNTDHALLTNSKKLNRHHFILT